jgi:hypothetical protein
MSLSPIRYGPAGGASCGGGVGREVAHADNASASPMIAPIPNPARPCIAVSIAA